MKASPAVDLPLDLSILHINIIYLKALRSRTKTQEQTLYRKWLTQRIDLVRLKRQRQTIPFPSARCNYRKYQNTGMNGRVTW